MNDEIRQIRIDLAAAYRMAARQGLNEGICNHFTMMVPGSDDRFLLIPYGLHWSEVTASNLIEVDFDGNVIEGEGEAEATAFCIHAPIHKARPDARCLLHTHMPFATALSLLEDFRFPFVSQNELGFYGRIAYDDDYKGLAFDTNEGDRLARVMGTADVVLLTEVYPAGEAPIVAADGRALARALRVAGKVDPVFVDDIAEMPATIAEQVRAGDVVYVLTTDKTDAEIEADGSGILHQAVALGAAKHTEHTDL